GSIAEYAVACECRKPAAGMLLQASRDHDIDLATSFMIGDILDDVEAGHAAGCRSILLDVDSETVWHRSPAREPDFFAADLGEAADFILGKPHPSSGASPLPDPSMPLRTG